MTTLMEKRRKNRLLSPWNFRLMTPWNNNPMLPMRHRFFNSDFDDLRSMTRFDDVFRDDFFENDSLMPAMNIIEHKNDFAIEFAAPGFTKKDFKVTIEDNVLYVHGEKRIEKEEKEEDFTCKEFNYNSFKRSLILPDNVDFDQKVKATYKEGILSLKLLKKEGLVKEIPKKVIEVS